ncbi:hypothetical protein SUGI_0309480 [Cryptomeria japonica]|uniref:uncharacterized protein LOC131075885 n=1 Tax=Cryptomeria japonica TaxID=3369 RepID=UPI002408C008|nr:uncharacterized protein LOC131075885 [Cryptomeria japonica]GLJ17730.1 hypothetical protein SUGI_0309480 [Cryptomeria japonica]
MATQLMKKSEMVTFAAKEGAEVYHGEENCKQKVLQVLQEAGLPRGLFPLDNIVECGHVRDTGFVWLKRPKKIEYRFKTTGNLASYAPEMSGYMEKGKMKKISGVKVKELLMWFALCELSIEDPNSGMIYCKTAVGVGKNVPIKVWEEEYDKYMCKSEAKSNA